MIKIDTCLNKCLIATKVRDNSAQGEGALGILTYGGDSPIDLGKIAVIIFIAIKFTSTDIFGFS